ncbi:anti-phage dCTP deaminase [Solidesulfovibrio sp. C21]|uniref:anti-phage dCTP deaminase n=1 Tax=Solidesulfovibrio sp. C21 TaxID=3398613 RepID=UPI0039FCDC73
MQEALKIIEGSRKGYKTSSTCIQEIHGRVTDELVIALCGAIGSGATTVGEKIQKILEEYGYDVVYIKLSDFIKQCSTKEDFVKELEGSSIADRYLMLQDEGNSLREMYSNDVLAQLAIFKISMDREKSEKEKKSDAAEVKAHTVRRFATIVDSLKHPDEWRLLQTVYGKMFYLFGVLCPENIRKERLIGQKKIDRAASAQLIERDKMEEINSGQKFIKTIFHADFFIRNIKNIKNALNDPLKRYIGLILSDNKYTPTIHEYAMHIAQASAHRSSCLSRQVGAAIIGHNGEIVSTGRNDVPKFGGGLYGDGEQETYNCYNTGGCKNDEYKNDIFKQLAAILRKKFPLSVKDEMIKTALDEIKKNTKLKDIIEFSRAVHAEMDAITSAARSGAHGLEGATLYCTTFPCHHCARHIVASGIKRVFYIEPYEKSLAYELHSDSIVLDSDDIEINGDKVKFLPFEGVAPKQFTSIFRDRDKKSDGCSIEIDLRRSKPILQQLMDSFVDYEDRVVKRLKETGLLEKLVAD